MKKSPALFYIALLFVVIVLADLFLWFSVTSKTIDVNRGREEYISYYPEILQNGRLLTVISILMLSFAGYVFINASKSNNNKKAATLLGLLSALLMIVKIYSFTRR